MWSESGSDKTSHIFVVVGALTDQIIMVFMVFVFATKHSHSLMCCKVLGRKRVTGVSGILRNFATLSSLSDRKQIQKVDYLSTGIKILPSDNISEIWMVCNYSSNIFSVR